jgi:hypothetical protein
VSRPARQRFELGARVRNLLGTDGVFMPGEVTEHHDIPRA